MFTGHHNKSVVPLSLIHSAVTTFFNTCDELSFTQLPKKRANPNSMNSIKGHSMGGK